MTRSASSLVLVSGLGGLGALGALGACGGGPAAGVDASGPGRDAAADAEVDAVAADAAAPDPWTQPVGAPLAGVTLADGWTDLRALPAPLAFAGGWTDSLFAQPDGLHMKLAYAPLDFSQFFLSNGATQVVTGPQLLGTTGSQFKLYEAALTTAGWALAIDPVASADPSLVEASSATNASGDLIAFTRFEGASFQAKLYYASFAAGAWSAPLPAPFNSTSCNDDNAKIVGELATSSSVYFESNRGDLAGTGATCGQRTLYTTTVAGGSFSPVVAVPGIATATSDDSQPFLAADQTTLYWTSIRDGQYGVFGATLDAGVFTGVHPVVLPTQTQPFAGTVVLVGEASVVERPEGSLLYLMCGVATDEHGGKTYGDADTVTLVPCVARRPR